MTRERMQEEMIDIVEAGQWMNWSFWEYENVKPGDVCYLVRCSDSTGPHGVMLRGKITSLPYRDEDWSGRGRVTMYADFLTQEFIDTETGAPIPPEELEKEMPDFNWRGGHSGRPLPQEYEALLERMWLQHLKSRIDRRGFEWYINPMADELLPSALDLWKVINTRE